MVHFSGTFNAGFDNSTDDACKTYTSCQVLENVFSRKYLGITATTRVTLIGINIFKTIASKANTWGWKPRLLHTKLRFVHCTHYLLELFYYKIH